jgi:DNA gyrase subunit A
VNLLALDADERIAAIVPVREFRDDRYLLFARAGRGEEDGAERVPPRARGWRERDQHHGGRRADRRADHDGNDEVILATYEGMAIRFHESDVREMGRVATGVRGIRLRRRTRGRHGRGPQETRDTPRCWS